MIGAIAGDIIGSIYEKKPLKTIDFPLFVKHSRFTDDTVLTVAVADCLLNQKDYTKTFQAYGRKYPKKYYGARFFNWIFEENPQPYNSFGNGSAMRVSPIGYFFNSIDEVLYHAKLSASVTHNHPEGIKGAQAVASAVFLANNSKSKDEIKDYISNRFEYDLERKIVDIRESYQFEVSCQRSVPESIIAFLDSSDFESAIRNAISLGGDSDTMACIAGGIAEAFYKKIPEHIVFETKSRLNPEFLEIIDKFEKATSIFSCNG
jgi:ADP-ribosylglycohydrolase